MEEKVTNLNEWAVEDVVREIEKNIARKFEEQKFDDKTLIFLSKEGSVAQLGVCGLKTVGDQMRLKEFVSESQDLAVDIPVGRRTSKPSLMNIKQCSEMNQSIYKAKRKAIRAAVIKIWPGNEIPTFKSNSEAEEKLNTLVKDLEKECTFAPLDFGKEGTRQHTLDVLNERRRHVRKGRDYSLPDKRTLKRKLKSNHASPTVIITSGGENSGNSSSVSSDQSSDTFPFYSSEEEDSAMSVVTHPKQQVHEKELQPDREKSCDKLPLTPDHENETTHGEATEEGGGLAATTAQIIICVAFNAIQISDVP